MTKHDYENVTLFPEPHSGPMPIWLVNRSSQLQVPRQDAAIIRGSKIKNREAQKADEEKRRKTDREGVRGRSEGRQRERETAGRVGGERE